MSKLLIASIQVLLLFNCLNSQPNVYWTDVSDGTISRADFDGTNVEIILSNAGIPLGITFDIVSSKMYWTDNSNGTIHRSNLDGSNSETLISGLSGPAFIKLDINDNKMYWTNYTAGTIQRANLDGSNLEILATELGSPSGLALDLINSKMYWTNDQPNIIQRSNLDGSDIETLFSQYLDPVEIALDVDNNRMYWSNWNPYIYSATLDGLDMDTTFFVGSSNIIGFALDIINSKVYWTNSYDTPGNGLIMSANLNGTDVDTLVTNLQFPFGIALSTSGLGIDENISTLANSFRLYQNYPNPFNPITTLRYNLPKNSFVNITIYDILGREVRTLVNTTQNAGNKSVIWDATNDNGKPVSAGVYLYQIRVYDPDEIGAGDPSTISGHSFIQTRKMVVLK